MNDHYMLYRVDSLAAMCTSEGYFIGSELLYDIGYIYRYDFKIGYHDYTCQFNRISYGLGYAWVMSGNEFIDVSKANRKFFDGLEAKNITRGYYAIVWVDMS